MRSAYPSAATAFGHCSGGHSPSERRYVACAAALAAAVIVLLVSAPAIADDKAACTDGIGLIKTEIAKAPPEPVLSKMKKALRVAEREQGEGEFDECIDAVADAKRALK